MSTTAALARRHALGLPAGSLRATHVIGVVGIVCGVLLIPPRGEHPIALPPYLIYLLFIMVGHYFAAHGVSIATRDDPLPSPLFLPGGLVRIFIAAALCTCIVWKLIDDHAGLLKQFETSLVALKDQPELPLVILGGFLLGVCVRAIVRNKRSAMMQDLEAWFSLIALVGLGIAAVYQVIIAPSLPTPYAMPTLEAVLGGMLAFYFGERS